MRIDELRLHAMGSEAHVMVVGGPPRLREVAVRRLAELERLWSRFVPSSEISRYNRSGRPWRDLTLSDETRLLLSRAEEGRLVSGGRFDPWILGPMHAIGYSEPLGGPTRESVPRPGISAPDVAGNGFDPGGIGKGLAADLIAEEVMAAGASGVLVNVGGDLRVMGAPPAADAWLVEVADPLGAAPAMVSLGEGGVATSSPLKRRWVHEGRDRHHLVDPGTGESAAAPALSVTVVAGTAWQAEVLCKVLVLDPLGSDNGLDLVEQLGAAALVVTDGLVASTSRWADFAEIREDAALR